MLSLLKVAQQFTQAAGTDRAPFQEIGDSLLSVREEAVLAGVFAFALGALMYYYVLYRSQLVPRWLSGWGIAGELLMLVACLSALFSRNAVTSYIVLVLPIAVQEMVMAVWLISRGFRSAVDEAAHQNAQRESAATDVWTGPDSFSACARQRSARCSQ